MADLIGFIPNTVLVPIDKLLPSKKIDSEITSTEKGLQIRASIEEIGLIEPLSVAMLEAQADIYLVLDGHVRLAILRERGCNEVPCIISLDDEAYTYNNRIDRLTTVQEHIMIRRAIERGVSPERLARTLNVDVRRIIGKVKMLDGICDAAVALLKDRHFAPGICKALRYMAPARQKECVEVMIAANCFTVNYAKALLAASPRDSLIRKVAGPKSKRLTSEQRERMQQEMANLHGQYREAEQTCGENLLNLVVARGYLAKLIGNSRLSEYIRQNYSEIHEQFEQFVKDENMV